MVMNKIYFMLAILLASVNSSLAQKWAVKSNLLYDATATINLGVEAALGVVSPSEDKTKCKTV